MSYLALSDSFEYLWSTAIINILFFSVQGPLEDLSHQRDPQLQVSENYSQSWDLTFKILILNTNFFPNKNDLIGK